MSINLASSSLNSITSRIFKLVKLVKFIVSIHINRIYLLCSIFASILAFEGW